MPEDNVELEALVQQGLSQTEFLSSIDGNTEAVALATSQSADSLKDIEGTLEAQITQSEQNTEKLVEALKPTAEATSKLAQFLTDMKGDKGDKGDTGEKGERGEKGEKGDTGEKGADGKDGIDGINGLNGKDGRDGIDGKNGIDGKDGRDGKDGKDGKDGYTPVKGKDYFTTQELEDIKAETTETVTRRMKTSSKTYSVSELEGMGSATAGQVPTKQADGSWAPATPSGTGGGHTIEDEGTPVTQRTNLNFVGAGVAVTDDAGNDATVVTISGGGSGAVDSVNGETGVVVLTTDDISDTAQTNKWATAAEKTKLSNISITQPVDLDALETASHAALTVTDSAEIDFTLTGQDLTASLKAGSIDEAKLDASVNASLDLADTAVQPATLTGYFNKSTDDTDDITEGATNKFATAAEKTKLGFISVTQAVDLDTMESDIAGKQPLDSDLTAIAGLAASNDDFIQRKAGAWTNRTIAQVKTDLSLTGTNSGDQTSIVGITGTKAQFDTAVTDGNFLYVGDVTQYTDELAQDAVGAMVDSTIVYNDATPSLSRAALTGAITASAGSNTTSLGSFTKAQLDTAVSDGNVLYVGDVTTNATHTGEVTGSGALTVDKTAITNKTLVTAAVGDQVLIADASDTDNLKRVTVQTIIDLAGGGGNTFNDIYVDQSGGTSDTYGALSGTINGSNALFTVSQSVYATGTLKVYLNGQLLTQGSGEDWVETTPASGTFTFNTAPPSGSLITVEYQKVVTNSDTIVTTADYQSAVVRVVHGATAGTARPTGATYVEWVGSVEPTNATDNDTWVETA